MIDNLEKGQLFFALDVPARAYDKSMLAFHLVLLVFFEMHHLFAASEVTLVLNFFKEDFAQKAPSLSHGLPAGGAVSPLALLDLLKAGGAHKVAPGTARHRSLFWNVKADRALHLGLHLLHQHPVLCHLLLQFLPC